MADEAPKADELLPPVRNFALSLAERVRAQEGVPAHLRRKRQIEDLLGAALARLKAAAEEGARDGELERCARAVDCEPLNGLIDRHNRYYPIEARLPIDVRSGDSLDERGRRWRPLPRVTAALLVELFRAGRDSLD